MFFAHIMGEGDNYAEGVFGSGNESFVRINGDTWEEAEKNLATYIGIRSNDSCNAEEVTLYQVSGSKKNRCRERISKK